MRDEVWMRDEIESPCVKICVVHPEARICTGCYRTIDEITAWSRMTPEARRETMATLPDRAALLPQTSWRSRRTPVQPIHYITASSWQNTPGERALPAGAAPPHTSPLVEHPLAVWPKRMKREGKHHVMRHVLARGITYADCSNISAFVDIGRIQRGGWPGAQDNVTPASEICDLVSNRDNGQARSPTRTTRMSAGMPWGGSSPGIEKWPV